MRYCLSTVIMEKEIITNKIKFANINTKEDYVFWLKITLNGNKIFALKNKWDKYLNKYKFVCITIKLHSTYGDV